MKEYVVLKKKLSKNELMKVKEKIESRKCKEIIDGEKPVKCFFQRFTKTELKGRKILGLKDSDGVLKERLNDILSIASDFYSDLYKKRDCDIIMT